MPDRLRVLLLERNRYRSLLITRALLEMSGSAVIARFESGTEVVRELLSTAYDIAITNINGVAGRAEDFVRAVRVARRGTILIALGGKETPKAVASEIESIADRYLVWPEDPSGLLPDEFRRTIRTVGRFDSAVDLPDEVTADPVLIA